MHGTCGGDIRESPATEHEFLGPSTPRLHLGMAVWALTTLHVGYCALMRTVRNQNVFDSRTGIVLF